jgi:hypothetical protein
MMVKPVPQRVNVSHFITNGSQHSALVHVFAPHLSEELPTFLPAPQAKLLQEGLPRQHTPSVQPVLLHEIPAWSGFSVVPMPQVKVAQLKSQHFLSSQPPLAQMILFPFGRATPLLPHV